VRRRRGNSDEALALRQCEGALQRRRCPVTIGERIACEGIHQPHLNRCHLVAGRRTVQAGRDGRGGAGWVILGELHAGQEGGFLGIQWDALVKGLEEFPRRLGWSTNTVKLSFGQDQPTPEMGRWPPTRQVPTGRCQRRQRAGHVAPGALQTCLQDRDRELDRLQVNL
jgi:hypothetical protein